ncbi:MAG TPA: hypothetical protein VKZ53_21345 [Candidatus Angelobacter sp.]|nr:hypothetical protein [Candidatus Angelobacter sp.]
MSWVSAPENIFRPNKPAANFLYLAVVLCVLCGALLWSKAGRETNARPRIYLWAWERRENLKQADPAEVGIAYLAETIKLSQGGMETEPRKQPLAVAPNAQVIAVVRIEASRSQPPVLDKNLQESINADLDRLLASRDLRELQIDFDAMSTQRGFYRTLLTELRRNHPKLRLGITALASWCLGDRWMHGLPIDEAVPMLFRMGPEARSVRDFLNDGGDFQEPLCRNSYGLSLDEPRPKLPERRRIYWFNPEPWTQSEIKMVSERW